MNSQMFMELPVRRLFVKCVTPAVITAVFGALYSVVDGFFVGKFLGGDALAAVNLIMPIIMIVEAISNMVATGASVSASVQLGNNNREEASMVFSTAIKFILIFSCVAGIVGFAFAKPFIGIIAPGANEEAIRCGTDYLKVFAGFAPLILVYFATDNFLRVCGKQKLCMIINVSTQLLNVILDVILIAVLHKGVMAAAAASCISMALGTVVTLLLFTGRRMDLYYTVHSVTISKFGRAVFNGASEFFSTIAVSVISVIMNLVLLKFGGTTAVAAFSVVMYVDGVVGMILFGISDAMQPAISYCYGAKAISRMRSIFRLVVKVDVLISMAVFVVMFIAGPYIAMLFIKEGDVALIEMSRVAVRIFAFSYLFGWADTCVSSLFTALEMPGRSMIVSVFGILIFPIGFLFILTPIWGLNGVWLMLPVSGAASALLAIILYRRQSIAD